MCDVINIVNSDMKFTNEIRAQDRNEGEKTVILRKILQ